MKVITFVYALFFVLLAQSELVPDENTVYDADGKIVTEDMTYEELMDYSDELWNEVETGLKTPQAADQEFSDHTGFEVLDWMVANGEIQLAQDEGMIESSSEEKESELGTPTLFQKSFLSR